ncbi:hypothetical protein ETH_00033880, partial [Eimeria tenella]
IEVEVQHSNWKQRLEDAGEMIFAYIAGLTETPPGDWFVAEQQRLAAFKHIFFLPHDILQATIDLATETLPSRVVDMRGLSVLFPIAAAVADSAAGVGPLFGSKEKQQQLPPAALYVHPTFSRTAFNAVRVYIQTPRTVRSWALLTRPR